MTDGLLSEAAADLNVLSDYKRAARMFSDIAAQHDRAERGTCKVVIVTHALPSVIAFLEALQREFGVAAVIAKPYSIHRPAYEMLCRNGFVFSPLTKKGLRERQEESLETLRLHVGDDRFVVLDMGGYFAATASRMKASFMGQMVGIVEDTENGHRKYVDALFPQGPAFPLVSSARSPLKEPEDTLIGLSLVFSAEAELRTRNIILLNKNALVLGYGKIGRGVAESLRRRDVDVYVCDTDHERSVQARSHGFKIVSDIRSLLPHIDITFSATGNRALGLAEFARMKDEAYVVSSTSADDEMHREHLAGDGYVRTPINNGATVRYTKGGKSIYLIADGEAANFLHCAAVGPYIHLIQGEIFGAALAVASGKFPPGLHGVAAGQRQIVAETWKHAFNGTCLTLLT
jgi:adenosylhomocysteinase